MIAGPEGVMPLALSRSVTTFFAFAFIALVMLVAGSLPCVAAEGRGVARVGRHLQRPEVTCHFALCIHKHCVQM